MKIEITKDWCIRMAQLEADAEIGAGLLAIDPVFDGEVVPVEAPEETRVRVRPFRTADASQSRSDCGEARRGRRR